MGRPARPFFALVILLAVGGAPGCLQSVGVHGAGHLCAVDADCADEGPCLRQLCRGFAGGRDTQPDAGRIRAALFVSSFPYFWPDAGSVEVPSAGYYDSADLQTERQQIAALDYGRIDVALNHWWGVNSPTSPLKGNANLLSLVAQAGDAGVHVRFAVLYSRESSDTNGTGTSGQQLAPELMVQDLSYLYDQVAFLPGYFRIAGRPVLFVDTNAADDCTRVKVWNGVVAGFRADGGVAPLIRMRYQSSMADCDASPELGYFGYVQSRYLSTEVPSTASVIPGSRRDVGSVWIARDPSVWRQTLLDAEATDANLILINSFNQWGDGTAVESSTSWPSASGFGVYLDILHDPGTAL